MLAEKLRDRVISLIDMSRNINEDELENLIDDVIQEQDHYHYISIKKRVETYRYILNSIRGLGVIDDLIRDDDITEIMINGSGNIFVEKGGRIIRSDKTIENEERLNDIIQQIVGSNNRRINETNPISDARLEDGSRVNIIIPPIAIDGAAITIRKFAKKKISMEQLIKQDSISKEAAELLERLVKSGYNIFVSGGTGSGKTTFLNILSNYIPKDQRVVTIEDCAELQLKSIENLVRLETRIPNSEGENEISIRDLIKTSLRMRPDRIIVGEVRGPESLDMLQAMNTGHDGSMSTGHSNSPGDMLARIETMVLMGVDMPLLAIRNQIASAIDIVVHLGRMPDKSRRVLEISELNGLENNNIKLNALYQFKESVGFIKVGDLINREKLKLNGGEYGIKIK